MATDEPSRELEPVFQSLSPDETELIASLLRANGITPYVFGQPVRIVGIYVMGAIAPMRVMVQSSRADEARQLIKSQVHWLQPAHHPGVPDRAKPDRTVTILIISAIVFMLWYFFTALHPAP